MKKNIEKYASKGRTDVRREKRAVFEEDWIKKLLNKVPIATIASVHEGQPFTTPVSFVYVEDANALYFHGAKVGRMRANIAINPRVCVNLFELGLLFPQERAAEFGLEYESVTLFGNAMIIEDQGEAMLGLEALMEKFFYQLKAGEDYIPMEPEEVQRTGVFKIEIEEWSGKRLVSDRDDKFAYKPRVSE